MSAVGDVFRSLPDVFQAGVVSTPRRFYFSLGDEEKWTVALSGQGCEVQEGKVGEDADCFFKADTELFLRIWEGSYVPSAKDFLIGAIKSNNPLMLKEFMAAFGKGGL